MSQFDADRADAMVVGSRVLLRFIKIAYVIEYCSNPGGDLIDSRRSSRIADRYDVSLDLQRARQLVTMLAEIIVELENAS